MPGLKRNLRRDLDKRLLQETHRGVRRNLSEFSLEVRDGIRAARSPALDVTAPRLHRGCNYIIDMADHRAVVGSNQTIENKRLKLTGPGTENEINETSQSNPLSSKRSKIAGETCRGEGSAPKSRAVH